MLTLVEVIMQNPNEKSIAVVGNDKKHGPNDIKSLFINTAQNQLILNETGSYPDKEDVQINYRDQSYTLQMNNGIGAENYDKLRPLHYQNKDLIILLFSFEDLEDPTKWGPLSWLAEIKHYQPNVPVVVVGIEDGKFDPKKEPKGLGQVYIRVPNLSIENVNAVLTKVVETLLKSKVEQPVSEQYTREALVTLYQESDNSSYLKLLPQELYTSFLDYATSTNARNALTMFGKFIPANNTLPVIVREEKKEEPKKEVCAIS